MLSRALEEERRSCAGTLPRPLPNMQVMRKCPRGRCVLSSSKPSPLVLCVVTFILPSVWTSMWGVKDLPVQREEVVNTQRCSLTPYASHFYHLLWFPSNHPRFPLKAVPSSSSRLPLLNRIHRVRPHSSDSLHAAVFMSTFAGFSLVAFFYLQEKIKQLVWL